MAIWNSEKLESSPIKKTPAHAANRVTRRGDAALTPPVDNPQPHKTEMDDDCPSADAGATPGDQKTQNATRRNSKIIDRGDAALTPPGNNPRPHKTEIDGDCSSAAARATPGDQKPQIETRRHSKFTHRFHTPATPFLGHLLFEREKYDTKKDNEEKSGTVMNEVFVCPRKGVVANNGGQSGSMDELTKRGLPRKTKMAIIFDSSSSGPSSPSSAPGDQKTQRIEGHFSSYSAGESSSSAVGASSSTPAELPSDIVQEILSRSTVEMAARSRCVSTLWQSSASSPHFSALQHQLDTSPPALLIHTYTNEGHIVYTYGPMDPQPHVDQIEEFPGSEIPEFHNLSFVGSTNGLFLAVCNLECTEIYMWNPCTGFSLDLPAPILEFSEKIYDHPCVGLGFIPGGNIVRDYFIIRVLPRKDDHPDDVELFSLSTLTWEILTNRVKTFMTHYYSYVASGIPYWFSLRSENSPIEVLVWFSCMDRTFYVEDLPFPSEDIIGVGDVNHSMCAVVNGEEEEHPHKGLWMKVREGMAGWIRNYSHIVVGNPFPDVVGFYQFEGETLIVCEDLPGNNITFSGVDGAGMLEVRQVVHLETPIHADKSIAVFVWRKTLIEPE